ncbi:MAG: hypothetical protein Q4C35_03795 [Eubacteriales bacterium]|nr:hypothetical protein [Eubacteriales bacterium]
MTTAYSYDSVGNLLEQATSGASEIAFSYNQNGYITGEVRTENGQTTESAYAYDALGQLTSFLQSTGYESQKEKRRQNHRYFLVTGLPPLFPFPILGFQFIHRFAPRQAQS